MTDVKPGDIHARSNELDSFVMEWEMETFFERLIDFCKQCSIELLKYDYESDAIILCGEYRNLKKKERSGTIDDDQILLNERKFAKRGMMIKQDVLNEYARRLRTA